MLDRGVSRTYCLAVILVFHVKGVGLMSTNLQKILQSVFLLFFFHLRPYLLDGGLSLLAVDIDGYPAGAALCHNCRKFCDNWNPFQFFRISQIRETFITDLVIILVMC